MSVVIKALGIDSETGQQKIYSNGDSLSGGGGSPSWGSIGGTLSAQTDLQSVLDGKTTLAEVKADIFSGLAKITVGTTEPGSPSTGDLWIDCN